MSVQALIRQAQEVGVELRLVDGKVKAKGSRVAVERMLVPLRQHKAELIRWFTETPANDPEPNLYPSNWHSLARAYDAHHHKCPTCIAAGWGYGLRCGVGASLWLAYSNMDLGSAG